MADPVQDPVQRENQLPLSVVADLASCRLLVQYDSRRFEAETIIRLADHLQTLLAGIAAAPTAPLAALPLLTQAERQQLLVEWNNTEAAYPEQDSIHQAFEAQARRSPETIALILPDLETGTEQRLTYGELNQRSTHLAMQLQRLGVGRETLVALVMDRSLEMIGAILAILKAGGVYVPLDPSYPAERLAFMLEDSAAAVLLTQSHLKDQLPPHQARLVCLDRSWGVDPIDEAPPEWLACPSQPQELAYVNYTSGSTGRPKGVAIPHQAVLRLIFNATYARLDGNQTILQLAPISFDAATFEIWGALLHGGCSVLFPGNGIPAPRDLATVVRRYRITTLWLTAALFNTIVAEAPEALLGIQELLTGGEALSVPHIRLAQAHLPTTQLINGYGPTESTTFTCCYRIPNPLPPELLTIPIGSPIANTQVYILDAQLQPVPIGVTGELYIGGDGLARHYLNQPDLTQTRFIANPFSPDPTARLYKTGDLVRYRSTGDIEFIGREDHQVKIRGYRIELGEIEVVLGQHPLVQDAIVLVQEADSGDKRIVAYVTESQALGPTLSIRELKSYLSQRLASYMLPTAILVLDKIPLTPNGKLDRRALPKPVASRTSSDFVAPTTAYEQQLAEIWSGVLGVEALSITENFFDLGGSSLLGLQLVTRVQKRFNSRLRPVQLYEYPTIRAMASYLDQEQGAGQDVEPDSPQQPQQPLEHPGPVGRLAQPSTGDIAIIAMVGRFPGAASVDQLWQNLCAGVESITRFDKAELDPSEDQEICNDPHYVAAKGIVESPEMFDAAFFGISPREAEVMDPQARIFLELAHEALESAGYTPETCNGLIGLYAGSGQNTYFERHLWGSKAIVDRLGAFQTMLANEKDFLTTRTSYKLNLTGPSVSINTACSTSLVAVIHAVQGLRSRDCDLALAGGISITTPQNRGYLYQEGGMLSPDGHCRPFDAHAQGTLFNNGAGIVVLKRVEDALRDRDRIYAVIKGVGINNDGADKVSFTAPSVRGQAGAIAKAYIDANIHPETISYIEAHGTATPLGDPIEIEGLTQAFRRQTPATQFCAIGSIKSNVGHLVAAAGVAGLIKTALALHQQQIPASINFVAPNPEIDFASSPFYVNSSLTAWPASTAPRRAGVSSFGVGGTNAHVVLEEAPAPAVSSASRPYHLLLLSAKTETALQQIAQNLQSYLQNNLAVNLADVAYTLQLGRRAYNHRRFVIGQNPSEAIAQLNNLSDQRAVCCVEHRDPEVVFLFPGQGSQYVRMGQSLYQDEPVFRAAIDRCAQILQPLLQADLRQLLYETAEPEAVLQQTGYTQPALFAVEYALAQLWQSWGIRPAAMVGHSLGEFVAACLAGVFSLEDALMLVAARGQLMGELPSGAMLSVRLAATAVEPHLFGELAIAAVNGPVLCVVSGPTEQVAQLQRALEAAEVVCKPLHTSHAFHSSMMEPVIEPFAQLVRGVRLSPPRIPFVSTVTAQWITEAEATDPLYWACHLRATVRFAEAVQTLWQQPQRVLLEVGPRTTAATLARQQASDLTQQIAISSLGSSPEPQAEWLAMLQALGQLWQAGVSVDWPSFYAQEFRQRLPLPTYPFERQRYWIDPLPLSQPSLPAGAEPALLPQTALPQSDTLPPQLLREFTPAFYLSMSNRFQQILPLLQEIVQSTSGLEVAQVGQDLTFLEMGLDSLALTQVATALKKQFKLKLSLRHLLEDYPSFGSLAAFLDQTLPPEALPAPEPASSTQLALAAETPASNGHTPLNGNGSVNPSANGKSPVQRASVAAMQDHPPAGSSAIETLVAQQLQIMNQQLELLRQVGTASVSSALVSGTPVSGTPVSGAPAPPSPPVRPTLAMSAGSDRRPGAKIETTQRGSLTPEQQQALDQLIVRYTARTAESKRQTQEHRRYLADPRTVSGFCPLLKEMVYPIVVERSAGSKLWDVDGNEYVDLTNGFGLNFFGWNPDFVKQAVIAQMEKGFEIGPQTPLAGKVAKLISEFTGMERVAFCNTGSEAVMATLRLARTVTGRDLVATFAGDYHGTFDEVLYRSGFNATALPAAPGILPGMFENLLVLDYGTPESLEILRNRADDLAAILVEPVRSRDPGLQPQQFLQDLRQLTAQSGTAYIFDEVVTGFRVHPGGAQAYFGIQADLATYGKVVGGGLPIGIVAGKADYMDALDGGFWQYGDSSIPEVGVTFFAGTFVRHPLALAAAEAVLLKLQAGGGELQQSLGEKVKRFATQLNQHFNRVGAPIRIDYFTSYFYISYPAELPYAQLLFYLLRQRGIHVWDHRPCFFTLAHTEAEIEQVMRAFKDSVAELQTAGFLPGSAPIQAIANGSGKIERSYPPQPGARLGKDPEGNPAWFIPDPERLGKYLQVAEAG